MDAKKATNAMLVFLNIIIVTSGHAQASALHTILLKVIVV